MVGKKVRARREELGLTQQELADKMGYKSKSTINKIELDINDVSQKNLEKLAKALECDVLYLLSERPTSVIVEYSEKMARLSDENLDAVTKYIDYLLKEGKQ